MGRTCIERLQTSGILRRGSMRTRFRYVRARGGRRPSRVDLERIASLRLPPAWRDVAINASPSGRVQAIGRDAAGRWQYVYHESHVRWRDRAKYARLLRFGAALPRLRRAVAHDLRSRELGRERILAAMARILASALLRPGSEVYAAENGSYGLATLRRRHVSVRGDTVYFDFPGKSGKRQQTMTRDPAVARVVRRLLKLPGQRVFQHVDAEGRAVPVSRNDINAYIRQHMGAPFSAKDFRTWNGTLLCACSLAAACARGDVHGRQAVVAAIKETAERLGNTPAVCRSSYVSPHVISAYERGQVIACAISPQQELLAHAPRGLHRAERALLGLLREMPGSGAKIAFRKAS